MVFDKFLCCFLATRFAPVTLPSSVVSYINVIGFLIIANVNDNEL